MRQTDASIILIGPSGAGKTSAGRRLAARLGWAFVDLDDLRATYYADLGIDRDMEREAYEQGGLAGLITYWKPFELRSVERVMRDYPRRAVIAFGGGQSVYDDEDDIRRAEQAMSVASRVVLLLPDEEPDRALDMLLGRIGNDPDVQADIEDVERFLEEFRSIVAAQLASASNRRLATHIVITGTGDVESTADRIRALMHADR